MLFGLFWLPAIVCTGSIGIAPSYSEGNKRRIKKNSQNNIFRTLGDYSKALFFRADTSSSSKNLLSRIYRDFTNFWIWVFYILYFTVQPHRILNAPGETYEQLFFASGFVRPAPRQSLTDCKPIKPHWAKKYKFENMPCVLYKEGKFYHIACFRRCNVKK